MSNLNSLLSRAIRFQHECRLDEAVKCYNEIIQHDPEHADANHLLGLVAHQQGRNGDALDFIDKAIAARPDVAMYHANRGRVLKASGNNIAAASAYSLALRLEPGDGIILSDLAGSLLDSGNAQVAILFAKRAVDRVPELAAAHYNYGLAAKLTNQSKLAHSGFSKAIELEPSFAAANFELGELFQSEKNNVLAEKYYRHALGVDPMLFEAHVNLGNLLRERFELEKAVAQYHQALAINPNEPTLHANLGVAFQEQGNIEDALEAYDRAIYLDPKNPETQRNRAQLLLQMGRYSEGWPAFDWRWKTGHFTEIRREWRQPEWDGQMGNELTVLVHPEQGFGDTIQFSRYLPLLAEKVGKVLVECPMELIDLIANCGGVDDVFPSGLPLPKHDFHIPMMSFPRAFETVLETVPAAVPYLSVTSNLRDSWRDRIGGVDLLKVGLVWKGSHRHQRNAWRSPGINAFAPLFDLPGVHWVSLQKDDETIDLQNEGFSTKIMALGSSIQDFSDTAAVITHLDLVISPDTAVAHLAGAFNCPVWLLLPYVAEWRWLIDCEESPWYPSMRLFRQKVPQEWNSPIAEICAALKILTLQPNVG